MRFFYFQRLCFFPTIFSKKREKYFCFTNFLLKIFYLLLVECRCFLSNISLQNKSTHTYRKLPRNKICVQHKSCLSARSVSILSLMWFINTNKNVFIKKNERFWTFFFENSTPIQFHCAFYYMLFNQLYLNNF